MTLESRQRPADGLKGVDAVRMELSGYVHGSSVQDWTPELDGVLLAQHVVVNALTGNPSFIETFTEFRPLMLPFHAAFFVVLALRGVREQCQVVLTVGQEGAWSHDHILEVAAPLPPDPVVFAAMQMTALLVKEGDLALTIRFGAELGTRRFPVIVPRPATLPASSDIKG